MSKAEYMRCYRAARKKQGRPVPRGTRCAVDYRRVSVLVPDPEDYSDPESDVRRGP